MTLWKWSRLTPFNRNSVTSLLLSYIYQNTMPSTEETRFDSNSSEFEDKSSYWEDNLFIDATNKRKYTRQELKKNNIGVDLVEDEGKEIDMFWVDAFQTHYWKVYLNYKLFFLQCLRIIYCIVALLWKIRVAIPACVIHAKGMHIKRLMGFILGLSLMTSFIDNKWVIFLMRKVQMFSKNLNQGI